MRLSVKRAYEPAAKADGVRVLVDRLWPRGVSKANAHIGVWAKDLAPSGELRTWFHADPEKRYKDFAKKYKKELAGKKSLAVDLIKGSRKLTLITAARDIERSHLPTLTAFIEHLAN